MIHQGKIIAVAPPRGVPAAGRAAGAAVHPRQGGGAAVRRRRRGGGRQGRDSGIAVAGDRGAFEPFQESRVGDDMATAVKVGLFATLCLVVLARPDLEHRGPEPLRARGAAPRRRVRLGGRPGRQGVGAGRGRAGRPGGRRRASTAGGRGSPAARPAAAADPGDARRASPTSASWATSTSSWSRGPRARRRCRTARCSGARRRPASTTRWRSSTTSAPRSSRSPARSPAATGGRRHRAPADQPGG